MRSVALGGEALAVSASPTLEIDHVIVVPQAPETRLDLGPLRTETLVRATGRVECWRSVLQAHRVLWGTSATALGGLCPRAWRVTWPPCARLWSVGNGLRGRPRWGGQGAGDGFAQGVLPMAEVGCVVRRESVCHRGQPPGGFSAGRWHHPAVQRRAGRCQARMPRSLSASLRELCHTHAVALGGPGDEAQAAGTGVVLGHGEVFGGPSLGPAWGLGWVIVDDRLFKVPMALLLRARGGGHTAVQTRQGEEETPHTKAACPDFATDQMAAQHETG